jgi:hypothetical protein
MQGCNKKYIFWIMSCCCYWKFKPHGAGQDAPHVLDKLDFNMCNWIIQHIKCPNKGDVAMGIPKCHVHLQLNKHNT